MKNVTTKMSGRYSCEVSADAPSFQTGIQSVTMDVVGMAKNILCITKIIFVKIYLCSIFSVIYILFDFIYSVANN